MHSFYESNPALSDYILPSTVRISQPLAALLYQEHLWHSPQLPCAHVPDVFMVLTLELSGNANAKLDSEHLLTTTSAACVIAFIVILIAFRATYGQLFSIHGILSSLCPDFPSSLLFVFDSATFDALFQHAYPSHRSRCSSLQIYFICLYKVDIKMLVRTAAENR